MKYLKVVTERKSIAEIYVEVPDSFRKEDLRKWQYRDAFAKVAMETTTSSDWDDYGWEDDLSISSIQEVDEHEAKQFMVGAIDCEK